MDWQQKAEALAGLATIEVCIRRAGDWYIHQNVQIKDGGVLCTIYGNGKTPQEAIEDHWRVMTELPVGQYLVLHAMDDDRRRAVFWNGYMWADFPEPAK